MLDKNLFQYIIDYIRLCSHCNKFDIYNYNQICCFCKKFYCCECTNKLQSNYTYCETKSNYCEVCNIKCFKYIAPKLP